MVNSGTEATMSAIRVARGATGRPKLLKFAGNYHGHSDGLLVSGGTAMASLGLPASAGVTDNAVADTVVAPYNVVPTLDDTFAAVIVEPCAANMGLVAPAAGFLEGLRAECDRVGALLDLRRGHHRVPRGPWRGPGAHRRHAPTSAPSARSSAVVCRSAPSAVGPM